MNKTILETEDFIHEFKTLYQKNKNKINNVDFAIAAPFTKLFLFKNHNIDFAAQNMSQFEKGAYTGEISPLMIKDLNAKYVILGHSERREYFNESDEIVNQKLHLALKHGVIPIVCIGETLKQYEAKQTKEVILKQIQKSLKDVKDFSKIIIAYEPIWAIGTGKTSTVEYAQEICEFIRKNTSKNVIIQYGGSVNPNNIENLMSQKDIDGALVGGASLEAQSFIKLLTLNK
ncbi:Triosephosphate isomerase [Mesomycoplasma neurolyticum]|uniref:Triosephosphate isomerase n=2 Tax=Mesomycoplasma neurolyticum TaxID=2120 RepID=A0A449A4W7_9BACT|nr:triose-phosphate isomerase [Mesomycoplasma neurolyticum]VEU59277.1 Triosephosphate isomerase [Mesomycoplasma neurolyticum]